MKILTFRPSLTEEYLEKYGHVPLPPYIKRPDTPADSQAYQTVYSREPGSAAAPTAGLHFTDDLLYKIARKNIEIAYITLHVGLGTFNPVRTEDIQGHKMHEEEYCIPEYTAERIQAAKREKRPVIGVGTTVVRAIESSWNRKEIKTGWNKTCIFIYPPYKFQIINSMLTNFHTPESTLLMLVSAFAGMDFIRKAYREAVKRKYRFFSYGDAMLIE